MKAGVASDPGLVRDTNEDRYLVDSEHRIFAIADGVGGGAAGETAAEIAIEAIRQHLAQSPELREAIAAANTAIFEAASADPSRYGMACVLILAVVHENRATIGHVGDSRLYLAWNGSLRRLTSDHSPVGELEERAELTEEEAMAHPRRHEVFRDVGSRPRLPDEPDFVEIQEFEFKSDAAILLCSDGLSDLLSSTQINEIVELYEGDPQHTAEQLVSAANDAGGTDNITVIFVAGSDFVGQSSAAMAQARERHAVTRARATRRSIPSLLTGRIAFLIYGLLLGLFLALRFR